MLLLSNSGKPLYHWCKQTLVDFFGDRIVSFISAATVYDENGYFKQVVQTLKPLGLKLNHLTLDRMSKGDFDDVESFLVGGGNTYRLISELKKHYALKKIKNSVMDGALFAGFSAGANITGPNILTTNDWNVIRSTTFESLNIVPFNLNPHYGAPQDKILTSAESRDVRIYEYFEFHDNPVVAIEEETYLEIDNNKISVGGKGIAKVFLKGKEPKIYGSGQFIKLD